MSARLFTAGPLRHSSFPRRYTYEKAGYAERGRVPDFYGDGEAKVIFSRRIAAAEEERGLGRREDTEDRRM